MATNINSLSALKLIVKINTLINILGQRGKRGGDSFEVKKALRSQVQLQGEASIRRKEGVDC